MENTSAEKLIIFGRTTSSQQLVLVLVCNSLPLDKIEENIHWYFMQKLLPKIAVIRPTADIFLYETLFYCRQYFFPWNIKACWACDFELNMCSGAKFRLSLALHLALSFRWFFSGLIKIVSEGGRKPESDWNFCYKWGIFRFKRVTQMQDFVFYGILFTLILKARLKNYPQK